MKYLYLTLFFTVALSFTTNAFADTFSQVYQDYVASQKTENHQQTLQLAKQSVELGKTKFGVSDANTINLTYNLANSYAAVKDYNSAFDTMEIVTSGFKTLHGEHSEQLFVAILEQLNFFPKDLGSNLTEQKRVLKPKAKQAIEIANFLAEQSKEKAPFLYFKLSKVITQNPIVYHVQREAKKYTEMAYEGLVNSVGKSDYRTLEIQFILATIKTGTRKFNQAIELYEDLIANISNQLDTSHPYELAARSRLVNIYEQKGESEKATQHCIQIGKMTPWEQDMEPTPLFRVEPKYPLSAAKRGKEGWAKMSFTIDKMGFVNDVKLLDVKGGSDFGKESVKVLEKWRYAPKFEDGQAVTAKNLTVQLDFKLGK
jgi:TonB family protein